MTFVLQLIAWVFVPIAQATAGICGPSMMKIVYSIDTICDLALFAGTFCMIGIGLQHRRLRHFIEDYIGWIFITEMLLRVAFASVSLLPYFAGFTIASALFIVCIGIHFAFSLIFAGFPVRDYTHFASEIGKLESCASYMITSFYVRAILFLVIAFFSAMRTCIPLATVFASNTPFCALFDHAR